MKIILNLKEPDNAILAVRAVKSHVQNRPDVKECVYGYGNHPNILNFLVRKNKGKDSYSVFDEGYYE